MTAWQVLFEHAKLVAPTDPNAKTSNSGKRVLVTAAAGGVGVWVVQFAHLAGAFVVGTCGGKNEAFVKELGDDEVIDYGKVDIDDSEWVRQGEGRKFDVVVDCVGGKALDQAWLCVKKGGFMNSVAMPPKLKRPEQGVEEDVADKWFIV